MKTINVYDVEAKKLEELAEVNNTTAAEIIEMLMGYIDEVKHEYGLI